MFLMASKNRTTVFGCIHVFHKPMQFLCWSA